MAWPNPLRRRTADTRTAWGYTFEMTPDHLTPDTMEPLKHSYDRLGEAALQRLNQLSPPLQPAVPPRVSTRSHALPTSTPDQPVAAPDQAPADQQRDLYALLERYRDEDATLRDLWGQLITVPPWVDWDQIARGQDVFYRYCGPALTGLAYQSLLGGMGAARVVETLARTGGFSTKVARRRLFETTQHILQCTQSLESIQPGGEGFASTVRVRFLHAAVRDRIMTMASSRPTYFNVREWGVPINDLDSIATIGTFSSTLLWMSFPRQGIFPSKQEEQDYIALWRYIAYLIGCPNEWFESRSRAKKVAESLLYYEVRPNEMSKLLANNIIKSLEDQPPGYASADMLIAGARLLNGHDLCDALGLARPSLYYFALVLGQCTFFVVLSTLHRLVPSWDAGSIARMRKRLLPFIVESSWSLGGQKSLYEFKYIPDFNTVTEQANAEARPKLRGVEARNLRWLCYGLLGFALSGWATVTAARLTMRALFWSGMHMLGMTRATVGLFRT